MLVENVDAEKAFMFDEAHKSADKPMKLVQKNEES